MNSYEVSRPFWDWAFENPEKISPSHAGFMFWLIELNNRLGWKTKFGLPTYYSMEVLGIKSYKTYKAILNDLIEWGFVRLHQKATNNHSANIIELVKITNSDTKSLTKSLPSHLPSQVQVTYQVKCAIDKQETIKQINDIVAFLNLESGKNFKASSLKTINLIKARMSEGYTLEDFKKVISQKKSEWLKDEKMNQYLRPETLFGNKFESYLNTAPKNQFKNNIIKTDRYNVGEQDYTKHRL